MEVSIETYRQGTEGRDILQLCPSMRTEAGQELTVLRTTFSDCPIFPDSSQSVGDHRDFSKLFCWGVNLGTQILVKNFPFSLVIVVLREVRKIASCEYPFMGFVSIPLIHSSCFQSI